MGEIIEETEELNGFLNRAGPDYYRALTFNDFVRI